MKPHAAHRGWVPEVDEGDARDLVALLRRELRPTPGRLGDCLRIVVVLRQGSQAASRPQSRAVARRKEGP
jgi:hypothetical protein